MDLVVPVSTANHDDDVLDMLWCLSQMLQVVYKLFNKLKDDAKGKDRAAAQHPTFQMHDSCVARKQLYQITKYNNVCYV